jgi:hypothetical protein
MPKKTTKKRRVRKLTDAEFFAVLRENAGIYARTARAIEKQYGISYTRQSVKYRAELNPDELKDIEEQNIDIAEEGLHSLMRSTNERIKLKAIETYLKTKGRTRGYSDKLELSGPNGGPIQAHNAFTGFSFLPSSEDYPEEGN